MKMAFIGLSIKRKLPKFYIRKQRYILIFISHFDQILKGFKKSQNFEGKSKKRHFVSKFFIKIIQSLFYDFLYY